MSNEQTLWARHMEAIQQQEKALEDRWKRDRRERIATAILAGLMTKFTRSYDDAISVAVSCADSLIAKLDKPEEEQT